MRRLFLFCASDLLDAHVVFRFEEFVEAEPLEDLFAQPLPEAAAQPEADDSRMDFKPDPAELDHATEQYVGAFFVGLAQK